MQCIDAQGQAPSGRHEKFFRRVEARVFDAAQVDLQGYKRQVGRAEPSYIGEVRLFVAQSFYRVQFGGLHRRQPAADHAYNDQNQCRKDHGGHG